MMHKPAEETGLLAKGLEFLEPTMAIARHISSLRQEPQYLNFKEDLDKILLSTDRLTDLIRLYFASSSCMQPDADLQALNAKVLHDLCTPLIAITGYSEMILEDVVDDAQASEILHHVLILSQKILNHIKELDYAVEIAPVSLPSPLSIHAQHHEHKDKTDCSLVNETIAGISDAVAEQDAAYLLVVDDKESNRDFLSRRLRKQGFSVDVAENGKQALAMVCERDYDLILLDIIMPELNGYQMLARLKNDEGLKHIPVIMISALDEIDSVVKCIEMGAEDYLQKPFNQIILTAKITASLDRKWLRAREQAYNRTLKYEQEMTEKLLLNILPESIAERLKNGESPIADSFDDVTVLFADIVSFSEMSAGMSAEKLVEKLNAIFLAFDILTESHGLEKIKTIGDAYMLVGGMPAPRADHVEAVANMALDMQQAIHQLNAADGGNVSMRIGIHTGSVVAAVIGKHKFSYDLWGDAVIVASRMESHGLPGHIQISDAVYQRIKHDFLFDKRGPVEIKGKGVMHTYFLKGKKRVGPATVR
ncbi:MAG: adenylate/guanylate cyclase domain-containing protein [Mariprofundus sp.]